MSKFYKYILYIISVNLVFILFLYLYSLVLHERNKYLSNLHNIEVKNGLINDVKIYSISDMKKENEDFSIVEENYYKCKRKYNIKDINETTVFNKNIDNVCKDILHTNYSIFENF